MSGAQFGTFVLGLIVVVIVVAIIVWLSASILPQLGSGGCAPSPT